MLDCKRECFDLPNDVCFLNAAAWSPLPLSSVEAGNKGMLIKARPWEFPSGFEQQEFDRSRQLAASMINASPDDIAIMPSIGYGVSTAAKILDLPKGSRVIVMDNDHSSPVLEWISQRQDHELIVEFVTPGSDRDWTSALLEALASPGKPEPALLSISNVHWADGAEVDLPALKLAIGKSETRILIDATHAVGVLPIDVAILDPDFLLFPTYKWLLGPYGRAFAYIAKRHQDGVPLEQTSSGRLRVVAEDDKHFTNIGYVMGARRFDMGERDFFVSLGVASSSMELINSWGRDAILERIQMLTHRIASGLTDRKLPINMVAEHLRSPNILSLEFPNGIPDGFDRQLKEAKVYAAPRLGRLRIAPHVYNNETDCDRFVDVMDQLLK
ncbi:MAG: aminotransferase class V-fold PLP-dependent enzyme [Rhizobiaceae bacterium]